MDALFITFLLGRSGMVHCVKNDPDESKNSQHTRDHSVLIKNEFLHKLVLTRGERHESERSQTFRKETAGRKRVRFNCWVTRRSSAVSRHSRIRRSLKAPNLNLGYREQCAYE